MGKRRSRMRKKQHDDDAYNVQRIKLWSDLADDMLLLVMMKLEVVDFLAFSRVCKSWRLVAVSNRIRFIVSKPPMSIRISTNANTCWLKDFEGNKFKTTIPHSKGRTLIGSTCGYLILFDEETSDCWLMDPFTKHELHFPNVPDEIFSCPGNVRAILVFSPTVSDWVFVVFNRGYNHKIWFCKAGKRKWSYVSSHPFHIRDLIFFKGKIYTLVRPIHDPVDVRLCEMKLYPKPNKLVLLETETFPNSDFIRPGFVTCGENLYLIDLKASKHPYKIHKIDVDEMKWVSCEKTGQEYVFFRSNNSKYANNVALYDDKNRKGMSFYASMWYFFHDCLNVNLLHE